MGRSGAKMTGIRRVASRNISAGLFREYHNRQSRIRIPKLHDASGRYSADTRDAISSISRPVLVNAHVVRILMRFATRFESCKSNRCFSSSTTFRPQEFSRVRVLAILRREKVRCDLTRRMSATGPKPMMQGPPLLSDLTQPKANPLSSIGND